MFWAERHLPVFGMRILHRSYGQYLQSSVSLSSLNLSYENLLHWFYFSVAFLYESYLVHSLDMALPICDQALSYEFLTLNFSARTEL